MIGVNGNELIAAAARQPAPGPIPMRWPRSCACSSPASATNSAKGDEAVLVAIFDDAEAVLRRAEHDPSTIDGHSFDDVNRRLTAYGLNNCGS